jgi:hypothetical protein
MNDPNDPLEPLMERWARATPPQPESVAAEVWRRIAHGEDRRTAWTCFRDFEALCARPVFAVTFVAACVGFGLFLAEIRLSRAHAERSAHLERSYLELVDPLLAARAEAANDLAARPAVFRPWQEPP